MSTLDLLKSLSLIFVIEEEDARFVHIPKKNVVIDFLKKLIRPFLVAYWVRLVVKQYHDFVFR